MPRNVLVLVTDVLELLALLLIVTALAIAAGTYLAPPAAPAAGGVGLLAVSALVTRRTRQGVAA